MKNHFINPDKIIEAYINEPHQNSGEPWDLIQSHGWILNLVVGYVESYPQKIEIELFDEKEGVNLLESFGLFKVK